MLKLTLFLATTFALFTTSFAQTIQFKIYTDTANKFSFDIPNYWTIKYTKEQEGMICVPSNGNKVCLITPDGFLIKHYRTNSRK